MCRHSFSLHVSFIDQASTALYNTLQSQTVGCLCYGTVGFSRQREKQTIEAEQERG